MLNVRAGLAVGTGAALGACTRLALTMLLGAGLWPILAINILGAFLMGWRRPGAFWGTGFLGGFTTFSAMMLVDENLLPYLLGTSLACISAWFIGDRLAS
ncbi:fluoride efflux transporter family protein [Corynebacterium callunae]|uniref:fluoride efflux transporter family protein n=1 Tax=Corynebacterium callunae TaxID=1721 RepID=UPI0039829424